MTGRVLAVHVGRPQLLAWQGATISTAIRKRPVDGRVAVGPDGLDGDRQADLSVHGGPDKAICCYPSEHLPDVAAWLGRDALPLGAFGENLSLHGLTEEDVHIGDVLTAGPLTVQVTQPRGPCFKLAARWDAKELPAKVGREMISGFYFKVLAPGDVGSGDELELVERTSGVSVAEVMRVTYRDRHDLAGMRAVLAVPELAEQWRDGLSRLAARHAAG